jgi:chromate transporter
VDSKQPLKEVAMLFLKLGTTAFGGPAAHIAMMQQEVVYKKKWMTQEHFLDLVGATNLIPGPNSTEMAIHIGQERAGIKGLIVGGLCFITPAVVITGFFAWLYKQYGQLPSVHPFTYGIKPAIIAIVLAAIYPMAKKSYRSLQAIGIGGLVLILSLLHFNEIVLLFGAGFVAMFLFFINSPDRRNTYNLFPALLLHPTINTNLTFHLFWIFLKTGAILYGSGYVLFAFLDAELVNPGFLTRHQLIDAIAVGQFTPGPVFSSVTFIGYQINGWRGAIAATIGIFLPSFLFVALLNPLVKKMRNSKPFSAFLDAVNCASIAIILAVCYAMGQDSIIDWRTLLILLCSLVVAFRFTKLNSVFLVLGGSLTGYLLSLI